eukprot:35685-Prymnesium_polylepis.2
MLFRESVQTLKNAEPSVALKFPSPRRFGLWIRMRAELRGFGQVLCEPARTWPGSEYTQTCPNINMPEPVHV